MKKKNLSSIRNNKITKVQKNIFNETVYLGKNPPVETQNDLSQRGQLEGK